MADDPPADTPGFVGSQACAGCHREQFQAWQGSQHARAMQHATTETVLGDFTGATFSYAGVESRFYRRDGKFFVHTDGPDGRLDEFEIRYTFGVEPLQQYLVEFPDGRLQALSIAWDGRPASAGGQRWFHLYPDEQVGYRDELHWTRPAQNWNFMCADCHSTNLRKGYEAEADRFASSWSEISVGCEACHGPGSNHLQWARGEGETTHKGLALLLDERRGVGWRRTIEQLTASRDTPLRESKEQQVCAQCHSRRSQLAEGYHAGKQLLDHYSPALLESGLYHVDGQQREEVFISASFEQSRMHAAGVTCSDCHEPHGQKLRVQGNALCGQCHSPDYFDSAAHHFHPAGSAGVQCVDCHMPQTTYMVIDPRRDHSLRIPRPDLSVSLGTPNACNDCHKERSAEWAAQAIRRHHPQPAEGNQRFAVAWSAAEKNVPGAAAALARLLTDPAQPALVRASSAARLGAQARHVDRLALRESLGDSSPLVRRAVISSLEWLPAGERGEWLAPLLSDPVRSVRSEAARLLADVPLPQAQKKTFERALGEYEAQLRLNADRAEARSELARLRRRQGREEEAVEQLEAAIRLDALYQPAYLEIADLHRSAGRESQAEAVLRQGLAMRPQGALLHYSLGLGLVRQQRSKEALKHLRHANILAPDDPRYAFALALALQSRFPERALSTVEEALGKNPQDLDLLWLAGVYSLAQGRPDAAAGYADRILAVSPGLPKALALLRNANNRRTGTGIPRR
ncbi:ammonia-forming cytochrome c nitrite reductase subunit c552 [Pseudomonas lalucatii]|nr:ammonia-forming cytochrome c nitrite reductase subunit c552 [Pseudomonas lalucatii]